MLSKNMLVGFSNFSSIREIAEIVPSAGGKVRLFGRLAIEGLAFFPPILDGAKLG